MQLADLKPTPAEFLGRILGASSEEVLVYPSGHCDRYLKLTHSMQKGLEHKGLIVLRKFAIVSSQNSSFSRCFFSSTLQELIFSEKNVIHLEQ